MRAPDQCSELEVDSFIRLVSAGGEVADHGLRRRVMAAASLVYAHRDQELVGVAALKKPNPHYRSSVAIRSGVNLPPRLYAYELGWVFVMSAARDNGYGTLLSRRAIESAGNHGVFATSRTDNVPMHNTLAKLGFIQVGRPYASHRGMYFLQLFTRLVPPGA